MDADGEARYEPESDVLAFQFWSLAVPSTAGNQRNYPLIETKTARCLPWWRFCVKLSKGDDDLKSIVPKGDHGDHLPLQT